MQLQIQTNICSEHVVSCTWFLHAFRTGLRCEVRVRLGFWRREGARATRPPSQPTQSAPMPLMPERGVEPRASADSGDDVRDGLLAAHPADGAGAHAPPAPDAAVRWSPLRAPAALLHRPDLRAALEVVVYGAFAYGFDSVFHNPYCGWLFNCGCTFNWAGGWSRCNVHNPHGPQCPWCAAPWKWPHLTPLVSPNLAIALMVLGHGVAYWKGLSLPLRVGLPVLGWWVWCFALAAAFLLVVDPDYPYFLFLDWSGSSRPIDWTRNNTTPATFRRPS